MVAWLSRGYAIQHKGWGPVLAAPVGGPGCRNAATQLARRPSLGEPRCAPQCSRRRASPDSRRAAAAATTASNSPAGAPHTATRLTITPGLPYAQVVDRYEKTVPPLPAAELADASGRNPTKNGKGRSPT